MTEKMISASEKYFNALNTKNLDLFLSCFDNNAELRDPYGGRPFVGHEGLVEWFAGFTKTWDQFEIENEQAFTSGGRLATKWAVNGLSHSGKRAKFAGIDVFNISDSGLISRMDGYWDAPSMLAQIR